MNPKALAKLRKKLTKDKLDGLLVTKEANVSYLSNFQGAGQLLITPTKKILITDFRFQEQLQHKLTSWQILIRKNFSSLSDELLLLSKQFRLRRLGFEASSLAYQPYRKLNSALRSIHLIPTVSMVEDIRKIKSPAEIKLIKKAAALAVKSFIFSMKIIHPGKREDQVARQIRNFMQEHGAEDAAFDIIIASGKRSALPHAPLAQRKIGKNDAVLIDLGCRISGYNSDLTRTVFLGKIKDKLKRVYAVVYAAQQKAIQSVRAGVESSQIDNIARQYIKREKLDKFFGHALGHGIGREVHEEPVISPKNKEILRAGMIITIEPGVYIPNLGGVRIEDMVLVTKKGCEILTND